MTAVRFSIPGAVYREIGERERGDDHPVTSPG